MSGVADTSDANTSPPPVLNTVQIIGIAIGGFVILVAITSTLLFFFRRRLRSRNQDPEQERPKKRGHDHHDHHDHDRTPSRVSSYEYDKANGMDFDYDDLDHELSLRYNNNNSGSAWVRATAGSGAALPVRGETIGGLGGDDDDDEEGEEEEFGTYHWPSHNSNNSKKLLPLFKDHRRTGIPLHLRQPSDDRVRLLSTTQRPLSDIFPASLPPRPPHNGSTRTQTRSPSQPLFTESKSNSNPQTPTPGTAVFTPQRPQSLYVVNRNVVSADFYYM